MGAKKRKRPMLNEEAVFKLEAAGYEMKQFKLPNQNGYYVPLQLWSKYVGKFNPTMRRGWRVELNTDSSRQIKRKFNMEEINEMTASLGIGNGNMYSFNRDEKLACEVQTGYYSKEEKNIDDYKQPIKVGLPFITNIIQAHRMYNARKKQHGVLYQLVAKNEVFQERMEEDFKLSGNYKNVMRQWGIAKVALQPKAYMNKITLTPDGVLRGIKQPYGTITGVYVHFFDTWKTKREARYHVTFDHGARVVITNDWITRTWATTYPEGVTLNTCNFDHKRADSRCEVCGHREVHKERFECGWNCNYNDSLKCKSVMDYRTQNMFVVHKGEGFKIPQPMHEPTKYITPEERVKADSIEHWMLMRGHIPQSTWELDNIIYSILTLAGGRRME
jgi:hypothetical protein